ncbi:MAG: hypothetical protein NTW03_04440 [Verrucomicrobia bacterium]|nr:hypothetical protein [Verrucomicrobiota bacterium]
MSVTQNVNCEHLPPAWNVPELWYDIESKESLEEANRLSADK